MKPPQNIQNTPLCFRERAEQRGGIHTGMGLLPGLSLGSGFTAATAPSDGQGHHAGAVSKTTGWVNRKDTRETIPRPADLTDPCQVSAA